MAEHAFQVIAFFPNVTQFDYTVLWRKEKPTQEVMYLTIDERAISDLSSNYYDFLRAENAGFGMRYKNIFSSIVETERSKTWLDQPDPNSPLP